MGRTWTGQSRTGQNRARAGQEQGRAGQGRIRQGQGKSARQGKAGQCRAGLGRPGQGRGKDRVKNRSKAGAGHDAPIHFPFALRGASCGHLRRPKTGWDAVLEISRGLRPKGRGLRPKMGRSQYVKICLAKLRHASRG